MNEAIRHAKHLEAPNEHPLNPQKCFGCGEAYDSGESGYTGPVSCYCGSCLIAALDRNASKAS